jgi:hypothetical protein
VKVLRADPGTANAPTAGTSHNDRFRSEPGSFDSPGLEQPVFDPEGRPRASTEGVDPEACFRRVASEGREKRDELLSLDVAQREEGATRARALTVVVLDGVLERPRTPVVQKA